jgi:long-chain acyl-CoA synthetase
MNTVQLAIDALAKFGDYAAEHFQGMEATAAEILHRSRRLAAVLKEFDVKVGDRIIVMMPTCPRVPESFYAIWRTGGVVVPIMPQLAPAEIAYIVKHADAQLVLTSPQFATAVAEATHRISNFRNILVFGESKVKASENLLPLLDRISAEETICNRSRDDLAALVYTSGTTGHPKGVMLSHDNLISNTRAVASIIDAPPGTVSLVVLPMSHVYGILLMNLATVMGGRSILHSSFEPVEILRTIEQHRVERISLVPAMMHALVDCPQREQYDVSSLKYVRAGAAPLNETLRFKFSQLFDCRVSDGYGQSEATCVVAALPDGKQFVASSVGPPVPGVEVCIQDEQGNHLPAGNTGEICFRGPSIMKGYWKNPEATKEVISEGWLYSGDVGHLDENDYLFITDRKKDLIIKGGENISPRQIEDAIHQHPAVVECSVFGVPDDVFQEEIAVAIVLQSNAKTSIDEIATTAGRYVSKFKQPKHVWFRDTLPKTGTGKTQKHRLKAEWIETFTNNNL